MQSGSFASLPLALTHAGKLLRPVHYRGLTASGFALPWRSAEEELNEFMGMVSNEGEYHPYFLILEGRNTINRLRALVNSCPAQYDEYTVIAMSTAHLSSDDRDALDQAVADGEMMVLKRDSGFFIKLYDEESLNYRHGHSESIKDIIRWAYQSGYRMIEFDGDARALPTFPVFNW